jgi:phosphoglycolate phosphatase
MISIDALLFDLDGTLIDSKRDLAQSVQFLQKQYGRAVSSEKQVGAFIGDGVVKLVQRALPDLPERQLDEAVTMFKRFYREHCLDHTRLYPGVLLTLKHFRRKKMAVVTNKPVRISGHLLEELGISAFFEVLIGGDSLPRKKPHPEPVLNALKTMRLQNPKRAVMVGDGPNDIHAGRAAGTYTCGVRSNIGDFVNLRNSRPDFTIAHIKELMRIFG